MLRTRGFSLGELSMDASRGSSDIDSARCLRQSRPAVLCDICVKACPVGAIAVGSGTIQTTEGCLGCGVCSRACPGGAIHTSGFEPPEQSAVNLRVECSLVPADRIARGAWSVPCLGGLPAAAVAAAVDPYRKSHVTLVDRGWCRDCPAANGRGLMSGTRQRLHLVFDRIAPGRITIAVVHEPVDLTNAAPVGRRRPPTRRELLRTLFAPPAAAGPVAGVVGERAALARLAAAAGVAEPALFPLITLGDRCRDHGLCAAGCPTGALHREEADDGSTVRLLFDPDRCLACGQCQHLCPEQAVAVTPFAAASATPVLLLRERPLRVCAKCEDTFVALGETEATCQACRKDVTLFKALRAAPGQVAGQGGLEAGSGRARHA